VIWWYAFGMSIPFTDMQGGLQNLQERQLIFPDRPAINDGLPHHEFVPSEFAPGSGRCDTCGGGLLAPIHQKPVDQMARIADALERIADAMEDAEQTAADRLGADSVFAPHDFVPVAIGSIVCSWCGEHRDDVRHHGMKQGAM